MSQLGQSEKSSRPTGKSALPSKTDIVRSGRHVSNGPLADIDLERRPRLPRISNEHQLEDWHGPLRVKALNRCAIARCAGSPTASTVAGVKIVDSARVALS